MDGGGGGTDPWTAATGTDTVGYASAAAGVTVGLGLSTAQNTVGAGTDTLLNFLKTLPAQPSTTPFPATAAPTRWMAAGELTPSAMRRRPALLRARPCAYDSPEHRRGGHGHPPGILENLTGSAFNDTLSQQQQQ